MAKEVIWSESAVRDRASIFSSWHSRNKSPVYSRRLEQLFKASADLMAAFPELGMKTDIAGVRCIRVRSYHLFYRDASESIEILRIWDTRRNPRKLRI